MYNQYYAAPINTSCNHFFVLLGIMYSIPASLHFAINSCRNAWNVARYDTVGSFDCLVVLPNLCRRSWSYATRYSVLGFRYSVLALFTNKLLRYALCYSLLGIPYSVFRILYSVFGIRYSVFRIPYSLTIFRYFRYTLLATPVIGTSYSVLRTWYPFINSLLETSEFYNTSEFHELNRRIEKQTLVRKQIMCFCFHKPPANVYLIIIEYHAYVINHM